LATSKRQRGDGGSTAGGGIFNIRLRSFVLRALCASAVVFRNRLGLIIQLRILTAESQSSQRREIYLFRGSSILPAVPGGDLFLYNSWNPRPKDAQETRVLAFYRALGGGRRRGRPWDWVGGHFGVCLGGKEYFATLIVLNSYVTFNPELPIA
jgi:hypothetical protein